MRVTNSYRPLFRLGVYLLLCAGILHGWPPATTAFAAPRAAQEQTLDWLYEQATRYIEEDQLELAQAMLKNIYNRDSGFKDVEAKLSFVRRKLADKSFTEKINAEYTSGVLALRKNDWTSAVGSFERVVKMNRQYRDATTLLEKAKNNKLAAQFYNEGLRAREHNDLKGALELFRKAAAANPSYRNLSDLIPKTSGQMEQVNGEAQRLYQEAINRIQAKDWDQAIANFEKILSIAPGYSDAQTKLTEAKASQLMALKLGGAPGRSVKLLYLGGALMALVTLPIVGLLIFSAKSRARALAISGNHAAAAEIYEEMLKVNPSKLFLYRDLADLYAQLNRRDKRAIRIYKTVVQFDLKAGKRQEIDTIVSQNYMEEEESMSICDMCDRTLVDNARQYSAMQLQIAVQSGLRPGGHLERQNGSRANGGRIFPLNLIITTSSNTADKKQPGLPPVEDVEGWIHRVMGDTTDWMVCPICASTIDLCLLKGELTKRFGAQPVDETSTSSHRITERRESRSDHPAGASPGIE
jgi:tetratricopeptide (TPR) repeat protein